MLWTGKLQKKKKQSDQVPISCLPIRTPVRHWHTSLPWIIITEEKLCDLTDGPLENLSGGGGVAGEVQKKYSRKGELNEKKNYACQLTLKKHSCYGLKKIHTRNLITRKNSCGSKIPHPPP